MWQEHLEVVRRRASALDPDAELARAKAAAVRWRPVTRFASFFRPLPLVAQEIPGVSGEWLPPSSDDRGDLLGLDGRDRPVAVLFDGGTEWERPVCLWHYEDDAFEEIENLVVRRAILVEDRVRSVVTSDGRAEGAWMVTWEDGRAARTDRAVSASGGPATAEARLAIFDAGGAVERVLEARADEPDEDLSAALDRAARLEPDRLVWDGRVRRPEPWPAGAEALVEPLAAALDAALREAVAASGIREPYMLEVRQRSGGLDEPAFPPFAWLGGAAFRDRMRRSSREDRAAMRWLFRGADAGDAARLELVDFLGADALRACRALTTALDVGMPFGLHQEANRIADMVGRSLLERLHAQPWPGAAEPYLALVHLGDYDQDEDRAIERARRVVGAEHVAAFLRSVTSESPATAPTASDALARRGLTDRDALEQLLSAHGLAAHAHRLAGDVAEEGLILEPPVGTEPRSRLGGPPVLPPGTSWPTSGDGRPLSFLAAIDLSELPPSQVAERMPGGGLAAVLRRPRRRFGRVGRGDAVPLPRRRSGAGADSRRPARGRLARPGGLPGGDAPAADAAR